MKSNLFRGAKCALVLAAASTTANAQYNAYPSAAPARLPQYTNNQPVSPYQATASEQSHAYPPATYPAATYSEPNYRTSATNGYRHVSTDGPPSLAGPGYAPSYSPHPSTVPQQLPPSAPQQIQQVPSQSAIGSGLHHPQADATQSLGSGHYGGIDYADIDVHDGGYGGYVGYASSRWYGGVYGLFMNRDRGDEVWLSVDDLDIADHVMTSRDASMNLGGGFETTLGRYFNDGHNALEVTYWGLFPGSQTHQVYAGQDTVGNLGTPLIFDDLVYGGAFNVVDMYNDQDTHRLYRNYEFHNVELNFLGGSCLAGGWCGGPGVGAAGIGKGCSSCGKGGCGCGGPRGLALNWLAGIRYLRFNEEFQFASDAGDLVFTGAPEELYYDIDVDNQLLGFQIGGRGNYCCTSRFNVFSSVKLGIYGAHISHNSRVYGALGTARIDNPNTVNDGAAYLINSTKNDVAFVGELNVGMGYQISSHWRATAGYRVVSLAGVALAPEQIPTATFTDLQGIARTHSNGSLLLHGGFAGLEFQY